MFIFNSKNFALARKKQNPFVIQRWVSNIDANLTAEECLRKGVEFIQDPTQKRPDLGRQYLEAGAERGSLDAAHSLASFDINSALEQGLSTSKTSLQKALDSLSSLSDQGHIPSIKLLAQFYSIGLPDVMEKNLDKSIELYEKLTQISLKKGINHKMTHLEETTFAYICLRDMYYARGDIENAYRCLSVTYQLGEVQSIYYLSVWFATGRHPEYVEKNLKKSYELCKKAAEGKHVPAMHDLGVKYLNGDGCARDIESAIKYFDLAAQKNYIPSKYNLALLYADGNLIESDIPRSLILLSEITSSPQKGFDDLKFQCRELATKLQASIE